MIYASQVGKKAMSILRSHYAGTSMPRIISMYTEVVLLKKSSKKSVTEYMLRAEKAATSLKIAGQ